MICKYRADFAVCLSCAVSQIKFLFCNVIEFCQVVRVPVGVGRRRNSACRASLYKELTPVCIALLSAERDVGTLDGDKLFRVEGDSERIEHFHGFLLSRAFSSVEYPFFFVS